MRSLDFSFFFFNLPLKLTRVELRLFLGYNLINHQWLFTCMEPGGAPCWFGLSCGYTSDFAFSG